MTNHPNRGRWGPGSNPTPAMVRAAREAAGLTHREAAAIVYCSERAWQDWEAGARKMHPAMWELWQAKQRR